MVMARVNRGDIGTRLSAAGNNSFDASKTASCMGTMIVGEISTNRQEIWGGFLRAVQSIRYHE
jgi:hypothetical protein